MKILYINHGSALEVGKFLNDVIRQAFVRAGVKLETFDFGDKRMIFKELLRLGLGSVSPHKLFNMAEEIASAFIPMKLYQSDVDFVFFIDGSRINRTALRIIKDMGYRIISWQLDDPYWIDESLELASICDFIFTVDSSVLDIYRARGCKNVFFLPLAFPEELIGMKGGKRYCSDVCLVGTPFKGSYRVKLIDEIAPLLKNYKVRIIGSGVETESWKRSLKNYKLLRDSIHESYIPPQKAIRYQISSKINLNVHRDCFGHEMDRNKDKVLAKSTNNRTFVLAGARAFQLVDDARSDLGKSFEVGKEIITFSNGDDLKDKIGYYLRHEKERLSIAKAAQKRALSEHTYKHRIKKILKTISS